MDKGAWGVGGGTQGLYIAPGDGSTVGNVAITKCQVPLLIKFLVDQLGIHGAIKGWFIHYRNGPMYIIFIKNKNKTHMLKHAWDLSTGLVHYSDDHFIVQVKEGEM